MEIPTYLMVSIPRRDFGKDKHSNQTRVNDDIARSGRSGGE